MQNYEEYRDHVGITQSIMVSLLRPYFPSFTKSIAAICNKPHKYGVSLCPEAEAVLIETFGPGPGLAHPDADCDLPMPKRRRENRTRGNRITVWMNDELYLRLISLKTTNEFPSIQALAEAALRDFIERASYAESNY